MDLRRLRYFIAIVEEGGFSEAARNRLNTSQSSLSRQIRELETELDVVLLDRGVQGAKPTAAGLIFLSHARGVLQKVQHTIDATRSAKQVLRVGCLPGLEQRVLKRLHEIADDDSVAIAFEVIGSGSLNLRKKMHAGLLDMALVWPDEEISDLHSVVVCRPEIVVLLPAAHPLSRASIVNLEELRNDVCVAMDPKVSPAFWSKVDAWFQNQGIEPNSAYLADNFISAISFVQSTGGFLLMPEYMRTYVPATCVTLKLVNPPSAPPICLVYRPSSQSSVGWIVQSIVERWHSPA